MRRAGPITDRLLPSFAGLLILSTIGQGAPPANPSANPLSGIELPDEWATRFWGTPEAKALLAMDPKALAKLVPEQAGLRFCRCPGCEAPEGEETLRWSILKPEVATCSRCGASYPNEKVPAPVDKKVPEETIEVVPGVVHHYPYAAVEPAVARYPEERLYLAARRDYEAREYLSKAALYAAIRHRKQAPGGSDPTSARIACVLLIRFAQVYPNYALHLDQPGRAKFFEPARRPPPYRRGYETAKWDWSGSLDVPINLAIAYGIVRDDPAMAEASRLLGVAEPKRLIENDLFRASAEFVQNQPDEVNEASLQADRGLLAVGRLLGDEALIAMATQRLTLFTQDGFFFDGLWRQGDSTSHRRVLGMLDGWIGRLLVGPKGSASEAVPILGLARSAGASILADFPRPEVLLASWPAPAAIDPARKPGLLGGAGIALLSVGEGAGAFELELRGMGLLGSPRSRRQSIRLAWGGRAVLGDLDDLPPRFDGWDRASASHNTVLIDGLNQRETIPMMRAPAAGGNYLFHAADPDFQVAILDDPRAYPKSTTRYRQTVVASSGPKSRYVVSVFEVRGGLQHDQFFHAPPGSTARWTTSVPITPGPSTLLAPSIPFLPRSRAEDGRWFVQSYGEFANLAHAPADHPSTADLVEPGRPGVRVHFLGDSPYQIVTGTTPREPSESDPSRAVLMIRRRSEDGGSLNSTFVTVFEPITSSPTLIRVGRMTDTPGFVVLYLETADGPEHLVINLESGSSRKVTLADGREVTTDGPVVRARRGDLTLAGGTNASTPGIEVRQPWVTGKIIAAVRQPTTESRGWFETDDAIPDDPTLIGRTLLIRHGDGTTHGWTLVRIEPVEGRRVRLHVHEEPGFRIEPHDRSARYYQFPGTNSPGPHSFSISTIRK
ncbi:hypothetical protein P12x_004874 [Tundrisphaera lichenicola]|uniref:hypothetical protein n=1 Tax=Tundrisphaera lichenicola TaxID=2029860 RepID=UPI003EBC8DEE